jgi:hypothetical protein
MRLVLAVLFLSIQIYIADFTGRVAGESDGDTILVLDSTERQHKI